MCASHKPLNTRHCKACQMCVYFMDHHCPFTGNCCGADNFVHFYMWLILTEVGLLYAAVVAWGPFATCVLSWEVPWLPSLASPLLCHGTHAWLFVPLISFSGLMGVILVLELMLLVANRSTLNWCASRCGREAQELLPPDLTYPPRYGAPSKANFMLTRGRSLLAFANPFFRHPNTSYAWGSHPSIPSKSKTT